MAETHEAIGIGELWADQDEDQVVSEEERTSRSLWWIDQRFAWIQVPVRGLKGSRSLLERVGAPLGIFQPLYSSSWIGA